MKFWIFLIAAGTCFSQNVLHQSEYRKQFADYLYCSGDYLRASEEFNILLRQEKNDTLEYKYFLSLTALNKYTEAIKMLDNANVNSIFSRYFLSEKLKILITTNEYDELRRVYFSEENGQNDSSAWKLKNISYFFSHIDSLRSPPYLIMPFTDGEKKEISDFYEMKINLPQKNPALAGLLSALIPGAGKIYTEEYGDAFFAALTTGVFGYLAYTNFKADHKFRGYLFSGAALWFYGGNVYGAAASANLFNAKVNFSFNSILDNYLKLRNYFLPEYGFCK